MLEQALERMPHRGAMRLIRGITSADEVTIACVATDHRAPEYPLRLDGVLHAATLVELGAQAAAAHTSIFGTRSAHTGFVLSVGMVELHCGRVPDDDILEVRATQTMTMDMAAGYQFEVTMAGRSLVSGNVLLSMRLDPA